MDFIKYLFGCFGITRNHEGSTARQTVAIVKLNGEIQYGLSYQEARIIIDIAFSLPNICAVLLIVDSCGGSPSETEMISNYLKEKKTFTKVPIYSFVMENGLSGGYWIACSGDKIFACSKLSMIGSISVKIEKVYNRIYEAETNSCETIDDETEERLINAVHKVFIENVVLSRGERLSRKGIEGKDPFDGDFWLAEEALKLGLIDGIQNTSSFIERNFPSNVLVVCVNDIFCREVV